MILPGEIQKTASKLRLRDTQIEKDYLIGWLLYGISKNLFLKRNLIFKGGTAIRKAFIKDYRLSEDLDFTAIVNELDLEKTKKQFDSLINWVYDKSRINLQIIDETIHHTENYTLYFSYSGPLGSTTTNKKIKMDISLSEILCSEIKENSVSHKYSDIKERFSILCYSIDEIICEKLRSLMQRTMSRDLYDVWFLLEEYSINIEDQYHNFSKKATHKNIDYKNFVSTVTKKESIFKKQWQLQLAEQIYDLPNFEDVWRNLKKHWKRLEKAIK
ncbi:MAG: nucleotidyl transferase AbiEii/AbiGii toxin family protein [Melioribacteraceae bacterium]|nr:nucleotidyl transferase AbiEii/AbiGii toxin family protein [Melioribacteraceae bacterium]